MRSSTSVPVSLALLPFVFGCATGGFAPATPAPFPAEADSVHTGSRWPARILTAAGGAALGAGIGFFASQVVQGDWDQASGGHPLHRTRWASVGGALGFTVGFSFPIGGRADTPAGMALPTGRARIRASEIRMAGWMNAYDAVENLRPEWLALRGTQAWRQAAPGTTGSDPRTARPTDMRTLDANPIRVYLDNQRLGNLDELKAVAADNIQAIYFLNASQATMRWGGGHGRGAILVILRG